MGPIKTALKSNDGIFCHVHYLTEMVEINCTKRTLLGLQLVKSVKSVKYELLRVSLVISS